ncbi:glycosyltransferase family 2 protein [Trueperella bialowiezensis]|uniref:Glycosyl transferase family 2 n=1 Tax=Trueperella bialowiezensis TaxID=312285 RepID=A0A448PDA7_9ACTO|nr:glycosyltransferase family 2 protein [Trueperella bialowiezensis]VEI12921.1 Glycosyl transferase family 2 [Trueperella bialowiezensis]
MRVDVIIAAHNPARPVARAARSIVEGNPEARTVVVCHNVGVAEIRDTFPPDLADQVTFLELADNIPSPSGPFMHGIETSTADFVSIMGSDDFLEPGAIRAWLDLAAQHEADAVIARVMRGDERTLVRSPAVRPWRRGYLDILNDRLPYRSAPLGIVKRDAVDRLGLRLTPGARNGGDLEFVSKLWAGGKVVYAGACPGYVEMSDASDRVTWVAKPVAEELGTCEQLLTSKWFAKQSNKVRLSIGVKIFRRNVIDSVYKRREQTSWERADLDSLVRISRLALGEAGHQLLSFSELQLLRVIIAKDSARFPAVLSAAKNYRSPRSLVGPHPRSWLNAAGSLRFTVASALMR